MAILHTGNTAATRKYFSKNCLTQNISLYIGMIIRLVGRNIPFITIGTAVLQKQAHIIAVNKKHTSMTEDHIIIGSSR